MNIAQFGPWLLLLMGVAAFCASGYRILYAKAKGSAYVVLIFGGLFAGLSVYGPAFIEQYLSFVRIVVPIQSNPSEETYQAFFRKVGSGDLSPEYAELGLAYVLDRPVEGTGRLLEAAAADATNPAGKQALERARQDFAGKQKTAAQIAEVVRTQPNPEAALGALDPTTRTLVSRDLLRLSDNELRKLRVNTNDIYQFAVPRAVRIGRPAVSRSR
jgi:hypothetical protein